MDVARRLKVGLAAIGALMAVAAFMATPAFADSQPDPTETNIPYLLWRGEEVRLVKCHPALATAASASVVLEDWSGEEHALAVPQFESGGFTTATGPDHAGQRCVTVDFTSQKAGIAVIKVIAYAGGTGTVSNTSITGATATPILKHQWLVGWMNLNTPVLSASNAGSTGPGPITTNPADLIDYAGGAAPGTQRNNFRVDVTGNIPLRANFRELGLGDTLTMPNDWPRLAEKMAAYFSPDNPAVPFMWDIHDDRTTDAVHGAATQSDFYCVPNSTTATTDAVDNCPRIQEYINANPGLPISTPALIAAINADPLAGEFGRFSRIWNFPTSPAPSVTPSTIGPFDPLVPRWTLLSNGRLDAEDAPMPAARIDFTTAGGGFFGCVGQTPPANAGPVGGVTNCAVTSNTCAQPPFQGPNCAAKDKHVLYSRDGTGTNLTTVVDTHNLYAPFYGRYIPATARPIAEASGELGPAGSVLNPSPNVGGGTNNFNGWLVNGLYHYWDIARVIVQGLGGSSGCLLRFNTTFPPTSASQTQFPQAVVTRVSTPVFRQLPTGPQTVAVYTDEHGEAHVWWYPGLNFPFGNLGIAGNLNLGCDLQGVNPIARPNIQAIARYPYQPVTDAPKVSNTIQKTVNSLFNKVLRCVPKGTNPNDQFAQICLLEVRDISGSPAVFAGEIVCFATNAELIQHFTGNAGPVLGGGNVNVQGTLLTPSEVAALGKSGAAVLCQRLDINGRAAVEVFGKGPSNVIADLVDEGLIRVVTFNFASGTGATGTGTEVTSTSAPTAAQIAAVNNGNGSAVQSNGQVVTNNGGKPEVKAPVATKPAVQARLVLAQLVRPVSAKAYLKIRVNSNAATAKIRIKMVGAKKTVSTIDRVVKTNRVVNVKNLKIAQSVLTLRVSIVS